MKLGNITIKAKVINDDAVEGRLVNPITDEMVFDAALTQGFPVTSFWSLCGEINCLGVRKYSSSSTEDHLLVWVVKQNQSITEAVQSVNVEAAVVGTTSKLATDLTVSEIIPAIMAEAATKGLVCETPNASDCYLSHTTACFQEGGIEAINELGVYALRLRSENDTEKKIVVWVLKRPDFMKSPEKLMRTGEGDFTHYLVSSDNGAKIRTSRDDVRAHVTNEINLASRRGEYIEDIGFRFDPLESFFKHAKAGDHTTFNVGTEEQKFTVTVVRLRNEVQ